MVEKRILSPSRIRRPPASGFSWVDRAFIREHAPGLSQSAILLYLFLAAVSDKNGLSFFSDSTIAARLKLDEALLRRARGELVMRDLVAYEKPLTQVLSLPQLDARQPSEPTSVGKLLPPRLRLTGESP